MIGEAKVRELLLEWYGIRASELVRLATGAGSDAFFVRSREDRYVMKFPSSNGMNHPELEPEICNFLLGKGLPVCRFMENKHGGLLCSCADGVFHLQRFIDGRTPPLNSADGRLLDSSALLLGDIHTALTDYPALPEGIGQSFFRNMTPAAALLSYEASLGLARNLGDTRALEDIEFRIGLLDRIAGLSFDLGRMTLCNTHGDYFLSQLICGDGEIRAVIDWTTACVHPAVWEIIRSYTCAEPACASGELPASGIVGYTSRYLERARLSDYDLYAMPYLYLYQLAVCDYFGQYYRSDAANRQIFYRQAVFSTGLLRQLDKSAAALSDALIEGCRRQPRE